jgi:hypothetical protein
MTRPPRPDAMIHIELCGGRRDGQPDMVPARHLSVPLALPEWCGPSVDDLRDPDPAGHLRGSYAQVIYEWDGTVTEQGRYRFRWKRPGR